MIESHFLLENLTEKSKKLSEPFLGVLEKKSVKNIIVKYYFWVSQLYWLFSYASKYIFP